MSDASVFYEPTYDECVTDDGVIIRFIDAGEGPVLVLLHGLGQSAAQFSRQIEHLVPTHRVVAVDLRGHGMSAKPAFGYRVSRLAHDVQCVIEHLKLTRFTFLGHSMGCAVIWCYLDLFGFDRVQRLVLVDEPPILVANPAWSSQERENYGAIFDFDEVGRTAEWIRTSREFAETPHQTAEERAFFAAQHQRMPAEHESALFLNHVAQDWRDVLPRISVPTMVIAGERFATCAKWCAAQIPDGMYETFSAAERGTHFMFWDNPGKFNSVLDRFLGQRS